MKKSFFRILLGSLVGFFLMVGVLSVLKTSMVVRPHGLSQSIARFPKDKASTTSVVAKQHNFHLVSPGIWRSAQPNEESLRRMKVHGLKTVVNLREDEEKQGVEKKLAQKLGLRYYYFPMDAREDQDLGLIDQILDVVSNPSEQPVLIHCAAGKDRTGLIAAIYKIKYTDEKFEDIYREMLMLGYHQEWLPAVLRTVRRWCEANGRADIASQISPDGSQVIPISNSFNK
ncbi:MAG TPA: tyrosine-protein phosphatase [Candidatus Omnitrophota bacterium]|nr:tyrosine-protein phosphatase [Candidatus Omnitrophota bacterium]